MTAAPASSPFPAARSWTTRGTLPDIVLWLGVLGIIGSAVALHVLWLAPNHDNDWLLIAAQRFLAGGKYLIDFNEVSPPMILPVLAPPAAVAVATGWNGYDVFVVYVGALTGLSTLLAAPILRWCLPEGGTAWRLAVLAYALILSHEPGYEFGQREHLLLILALPGILWLAARWAGRPSRMDVLAVLTLALCQAGLLIKPYYLLVPVSFMAVRIIAERRLAALYDGPARVFWASCALFALMVLAAFPEYLAEARLQSQIYFQWNRSWLTIAGGAQAGLAVTAAAILLSSFMRPPLRAVIGQLCIAALACLLVVLHQKKGWTYHMLPIVHISAVAVTIGCAALLPRGWPWQWDLRIGGDAVRAVCVMAAGAMLLGTLFIRPVVEIQGMAKARFAARPLIAKLREIAAGQPVMLLTGGMTFGFPSLAGVTVGAGHPGRTLLAGTVMLENGDARQRAQATELRKAEVAMTVRELHAFRPTVIAVEIGKDRQGLADDFDILAWFNADPEFRTAWADYDPGPSVPGWALYVRKTGR